MELKGEAYITENTLLTGSCDQSITVTTIQTNCDKEVFDIQQFTYSAGVAVGYEGESFGVRFRTAGPSVKKEDVTYSIQTIS
ncbi:MAG: hypothetical protein ACI86H_002262 [bacterium]|jgi:hypothetical protein